MTDRSRDDVIAKLRELDLAHERRGVPSEVSERVRRALEQRALEQRFAARLRWWPVLAFTAGAALMAAVLLRERDDPSPSEASELVERELEATRTQQAGAPERPAIEASRSCARALPGVAQLSAGECVTADGVRLSASITSRYEWTADRVTLLRGELLFDVESRPERPLEVVSGAATIEVIGTSFVVHQDAELGWVSLLEGHVRVRVGAGAAVDLREGQQLEWASAEPAEPTNERPRADDAGLTELLEEVAGLRRRGEYQAAVERLREGARKGWSARGRQLVSYEIGTLLERQLQDFDAACEHWAGHRERFPDGRYESIIQRSMARMRCADR